MKADISQKRKCLWVTDRRRHSKSLLRETQVEVTPAAVLTPSVCEDRPAGQWGRGPQDIALAPLYDPGTLKTCVFSETAARPRPAVCPKVHLPGAVAPACPGHLVRVPKPVNEPDTCSPTTVHARDTCMRCSAAWKQTASRPGCLGSAAG